MRRVTGLFATSIVLFFAPTVQCAEQAREEQTSEEQTSEEQTHEQLAARRWEIARKAECPTENCQLAIGRDDLPLGALLSYQTCSEGIRKSYVFRRAEDEWRLARYEVKLLDTDCPALPDPPRP